MPRYVVKYFVITVLVLSAFLDAPGTTFASHTPTHRLPSGCEGLEGAPGCGFLDGVPGIETASAVVGAVNGDPNDTTTSQFAMSACDRAGGSTQGDGRIGGRYLGVEQSFESIGENICYGLVSALSHIFSFQNIFYWLGFLTYWLLMIAQIFLGLAMWWLDGAIYYAVVLMGAYINHPLAREGIYLAWGIIRDLCNILIIGGFIAVGISTILRVAEYAADRFLVKLIIAALLVNFSYFFAGAIIDAANYVTVQIYYSDFIENNCAVGSQSAPGGSVLRGPGGGLSVALGGDGCRIARSMMAYTHMTSWDKIRSVSRQLSGFSGEGSTTRIPGATSADGNTGRTTSEREQNETNLYWYLMILSLLGAAFAFLLAWIFIQGAFMLMMRFVSLLFLLVVSPIGIAGVAIPYVNHYAGRWWSALFAQAVFAPVYVFLLGVSLSIVKGFAGMWGLLGSQDGFAAALTAAPAHGQGWFTTHLPLFMLYFIAVACLWLSYQFAKQIAESVPEFKPLYDMAAKGATGAFLLPKRMAVDLGGKMVRSLVVDPLAARTKEKGWARFGLTGLSAGMRQLERIGSNKKPEKGAWEEAHSEIKDQGRARFGDERRAKMEGGYWERKPFSGRPLLDRDPATLNEKDRKDVEDYLKTQKTDELAARYGWKKVNEWAAAKLLDSAKLKEIRDSDAFSSSQKKTITDSYFSQFNNAFNKALKTGETGDWKVAAKLWESMDETERQILLAERSELRTEKEFLSHLKRKDFDGVLKGASAEQIEKAKTERAAGLREKLRSGDKRTVRETLDRMSDDEKKDMDEDAAIAALDSDDGKTMKPSEKRLLLEHSPHDKVREHIKKSEKHREDVELTTGFKFKKDSKPAGDEGEDKDKK